MFFERGIEKAKVLTAAFKGDACNFDPRIRQQAAGVPEPQRAASLPLRGCFASRENSRPFESSALKMKMRDESVESVLS
jgi:hypothetical protein